MNGPNRHSAAARTRALERLRSITMGTAVVGFAGVGGFGVVAAISNPGTTTTVAVAGDGATQGGSTNQSTTTTSTTSATANQLAPVATPRPARRPAHVTTGGSG
jgi:hypothetical protein